MNSPDSKGPSNSFWHSLFDADSIAVVGASDRIGSWGFDAMRAALAVTEANARKQVYAVNTNAREVLGVTSYSSILDIPSPVDLAVIVVPAGIVCEVLRQCVQKKAKAAVIITAGFAEVSGDGFGLEAELVAIARQGGLRFVGPNCIGHADAHSRVASANFASSIAPGPMALLSQSGMLSAGIVQIAAGLGIGLSKFVSTGNEADLHLEDFLEYLAHDKDTRVITAYIEGLREGRRFLELAREITVKKPIIVIKTGATTGSSRAAKSHTGALAGSDAIYSAVFKQAGVLRADDEEELCDMVMALLSQPLPRGNRVGILTVGGGIGVLTAEACEKEGLKIASLETPTLEKLNALLPPIWSHGNPIDLVNIRSMPREQTFSSCLGLLMEDKNLDSVISILPPLAAFQNLTGSLNPKLLRAIWIERQKIMNPLSQQVKQYGKPLFLVRRFIPQLGYDANELSSAFEDRIPEFSHPRRAARAISNLAWYRRYLEERKT